MSEIRFIKQFDNNIIITNDSNNDILDIKHLRLTEKNLISINLSNSQLITNLNVEYLNGMKNTHFIFIDGSTPLTLDWEISDNNDDIRITNVQDATNDGDAVNKRKFLKIYNLIGDDIGLIFGGAYNTSFQLTSSIEYIVIDNNSNGEYYADLMYILYGLTSTSNGINNKAITIGGCDSLSTSINTIQVLNISDGKNTQYFGDLNDKKSFMNACSDGSNSIGIIFAGKRRNDNTIFNDIQTVNINTNQNSTYFGNILYSAHSHAATSNGKNERGVSLGGCNSSNTRLNTVEYITINNSGNANLLCNLLDHTDLLTATSNDTNNTAIVGGGNNSSTQLNVIQYFSITSTNNANDFGDLSHEKRELSSISNGIKDKAIFIGGGYYISGTYTPINVMEYVIISTPSDAINFGEMTMDRDYQSSTSNSAE